MEESMNNLGEDKAEISGVWCKFKPLPIVLLFLCSENEFKAWKGFFRNLSFLIMKGQNTILASMCDAFHFYFVLR